MKVVEQAPAATDHGEEAAAGGEIFDRVFEVGGKVINAFGDEGDLDIRGSGIFIVEAVARDDLAFCLPSHKKEILCEVGFKSML